MKSIIASVSVLLLALQWFGSVPVFAHPDHDHVLTEKQAILRATAVVKSLVSKQEPVAGEVLDASWTEASNLITCKDTPDYYLLAVDNRAARKTLYLLFTSAGKFLRANFDGHFADLTFSPYPVQSCS